eukprot:2945438-Alexandrium_andersonii.AAC.1
MFRPPRGLRGSCPRWWGSHLLWSVWDHLRADARTLGLSASRPQGRCPVSYTHLRAHETSAHL